MPCFGGQKIILNKNNVALGGGGNTNRCNFTEIDENVVYWKPRSFPIRVAISKDLSSQRTKLIFHAMKTWNEAYNQYLKTYIPKYEDKKYPYSLLQYDSINPDRLYTSWVWYVVPFTAPFVILDRIFVIPYENMVVIMESDEDIDNSSGSTPYISD